MSKRKRGARWTKKDRGIVKDYIFKSANQNVSTNQLARELAEKLERSEEGVIAEIHRMIKEAKESDKNE